MGRDEQIVNLSMTKCLFARLEHLNLGSLNVRMQNGHVLDLMFPQKSVDVDLFSLWKGEGIAVPDWYIAANKMSFFLFNEKSFMQRSYWMGSGELSNSWHEKPLRKTSKE